MNHGESGRNAPRPAPAAHFYFPVWRNRRRRRGPRHSPRARGPHRRRRADARATRHAHPKRACDCARITVLLVHHWIKFEWPTKVETGSPISVVQLARDLALPEETCRKRGSGASAGKRYAPRRPNPGLLRLPRSLISHCPLVRTVHLFSANSPTVQIWSRFGHSVYMVSENRGVCLGSIIKEFHCKTMAITRQQTKHGRIPLLRLVYRKRNK